MMVSFIKCRLPQCRYTSTLPQNPRAINRTGRIFYVCASACESNRTRLLTWPASIEANLTATETNEVIQALTDDKETPSSSQSITKR